MLKLRKKNSQRQLKVSEHLKRSLADIMKSYTFNNPVIPFSLVISEVNVSIDLKIAYVFVNPFWLSEKKLEDDEVIQILVKEVPNIRKRSCAYIALRFTPKIIFKIDNVLQESQKIENLFRNPKIAQDLKWSPLIM